ncbi:MAG: hypothetical protein K6C94_02625 [Candidatus Gastranaerophilales bacterium]|nr:hypothetical protein [Candidatus Gastranaerophilales bacterium]
MINIAEKFRNINRHKAGIVGIYGAVHALVDFCCAAVVYSYVGKIETLTLLQAVVIYNVLAFGLQSVFGFAVDKIKKPQNFSIVGCMLIITAFFTMKNIMLTVILTGLGNALFHTGGGYISLNMGNGRAKLPGVFVAPGAIGLFLGAFWSKVCSQNYLLIILLLVSVALMTFFEPKEEEQKCLAVKSDFPIYMLIFICILISICVRSFVGLSYDFVAKGNFNLMLVMVFAVALGKAAGGFISDKFGMYNTAVIGLLLSIPLLKYGEILPFLAILGMFCFNLTMPITVTALANMMPKYKGLAFGLTTLMLLIGFLPVIADYKIPQSMMFFEVIMVSVIVTAIGLKLYERLFNRP